MPYILNFVLGCWLHDGCGGYLEPPYCFKLTGNEYSLKNQVKHWNKHPNVWECIHYPCKPEHFELYDELPKTIGGCNDKTKVS